MADAFSDALGVHVAEESENEHSYKEVWESTLFTFLSKFVFAFSFILPLLLFQLSTAIIVSIVWGLLLLGIFSIYIAKDQKKKWLVVGEHLAIALLVILITHILGDWIGAMFG